MAELAQDSGGKDKHKGGPKQKKKSSRVDMTAMVDVAFLLLTFFILTTTLATPQAMVVNKPPKNDEKKEEDNIKVVEEKVMTIILGEKDKVHWFVGITDPDINTSTFDDDGIRAKIMEHLNKPGKQRCPPGAKADEIKASGCWDPIFVIKANKTARYENLVDIMDEMAILQVPKYAYTELTSVDSVLLALQSKK